MKHITLLLFALLITCINLLFGQTQIGQSVYGDNALNRLGHSVSVSNDGQRFIAGAWGYAGVDLESGMARVYSYSSTTNSWDQLGNDVLGDAKFDRFGDVVTISGNGQVIAVGSKAHDSLGSSTTNHGQVKVYEYNMNTDKWDQRGESLYGAQGYTSFGTSLSLSDDGSILAVGAMGYKLQGQTTSVGQVSIFKYNSVASSFEALGTPINGDSIFNGVGSAVSLSSDGNAIAVGAPSSQGVDPGFDGNVAGRVRVYVFNNTTSIWEQTGDDMIGEQRSEGSGERIEISNDATSVIIGGRGFDNLSGRARVFRFAEGGSGKWIQIGQDILGHLSQSWTGSSVSISSNGETIAVGSLMLSRFQGNAGEARVFKYNISSGMWDLIGIQIVGEKAGDEAGTSVSLSEDGDIVVVGSPRNDGDPYANQIGQVRVFNTTKSVKIIEKIENKGVLYPNPSDGTVYLKNILNGQFVLTNTFGQIVFTKDFHNRRIDLNEMPSGIYFAEITSSAGISTVKLQIR